MIECGVDRFALNLTNLDRIASKSFDITSHLPEDALWIVYADLETTWEMAEPFIEQQPYMVLGPLTWAKHFEPGAAFGPFWSDDVEPNVWPIVGLTDDTVKASVTLRRIMNAYTASILVAVTGATKGVERLDMVISYAWTMAQRFGETQVWAGNKLHRYAGNRKSEARPKHRADIERLGVDYKQPGCWLTILRGGRRGWRFGPGRSGRSATRPETWSHWQAMRSTATRTGPIERAAPCHGASTNRARRSGRRT